MKKRLFAFLLFVTLVFPLAGCGGVRPAESEPPAAEPVVQSQPSEPAAASAASGRQDGERFETVVIVEGMEETVRYEHVRNEALGFALDYDYESLARYSKADRDRFISVYDSPEDPWNYLEILYDSEGVDTAAASVSAVLSLDFTTINQEAVVLDGAGECLRIQASGARENTGALQTVFVIPAGSGSLVAREHYTLESAEGFGVRFDAMLNTLSVLNGNRERRLSDEQALSAVRNYCYLSNPDLEDIGNAGNVPVYWEISSSDAQEIVILFRSYTGALIRYYIDPVSGDTYVTEFVPGVSSDEEQTDERLNIWEYLD